MCFKTLFRLFTVPLAILQAYGFLALLNSQGVLTGTFALSRSAPIR